MKRAIKMSEFARLSRPEQDEELTKMVSASRLPPNGELVEVDAEIAAFERQHHLDSEQMRAQVRTGAMVETWDVCRWLMALQRRERLAQRASRTR